MNRFLRMAIPVTLLCGIAVGCGGGAKAGDSTSSPSSTSTPDTKTASTNPMTGTWKLVMDPAALAKAPKGTKPPDMVFNFKDDNTFDASLDLGGMKSTASGEYKLDGKNLTITFKLEDGKPAKTPPGKAVLADDMKSFPMPDAPPNTGNLVKQ